jgi:hypothetical protein
MPLRGETIGTAYVRILADGGGFSDSVRKEMRKSDKGMVQAGEAHSKEYMQGFADELEKEGRTQSASKQLQHSLQRGAGRFDAVGHQLGDHMMDGLRKELETRFGDIGTTVFSNLQDQLERGHIDFAGLKRSLADIRPEVARATEQIAKDQEAIAKASNDRQRALAIATERLRVAGERAFNINLVNRFDQLTLSIRKFDDQLLKGRAHRENLRRDLDLLAGQMPRAVSETGKFKNRMEELTQILTPAERGLSRFGGSADGAASKIGKLFGRGSRNDFLNFFGGLMSIIPRAVSGLADIGSKISDFGSGLKTVFDQAGGGAKGFTAALGSLASAGLPGLAAAVGAVVVLAETLLVVIGPLTSGAVLALAGSLSFALVGGLVAVGGALVPFAAALAVGAIALGNLTGKGSDLKKLKKDWQDLQNETRKQIFGAKQEGLETIRTLLKAIRPLILDVAGALGLVVDKFEAAAKSQGFAKMLRDIGKELAPMIGTLGDIALNIGKFFGEALLAAGPLVNEFLGWMKQITGELAASGLKPGGKGGGKSPLQLFFERASVSAHAIWNIIKDVVGIVGDLLSSGKDTGDNIFVKIDGWLKGIRTKLDEAKKNGTLEKFWTDAQKLAIQLGFIVQKVGEFIRLVDTPENRETFLKIAHAVGVVVGALAVAIGWVTKWNFSITGGLAAAIDAVVGIAKTGAQGIQDAWTIAAGGISTAWSATTAFLQQVWTGFTGWLSGTWASITGLFRQGVGGITSAWTIAVNGLRTAWAAVTGAISSAWRSTVNGVTTAWNGAVGLVKQGVGGIKDAWNIAVSGIRTAWNSAVGGIKTAATGLKNGLSGIWSGVVGLFKTGIGGITSAWHIAVDGLTGAWKSFTSGVSTGIDNVISWFRNLPGQIGSLAGDMYQKGVDAADAIWRGIRDTLTGALGRVDLGSLQGAIPGHTAVGGIFDGAQTRIIGEAGPEAVVPLNRPLSQVDPAVRALSAIAQGKLNTSAGVDRSKKIQVGQITVITPTEDPRAVATEVVARMAAAAYI